MDKFSLNSNKSLNELYVEVRDVYKKVETSVLASTSFEYQELVQKGIEQSKLLWERILEIDLFSQNETSDDISTEALKFIIVPGFIGYFVYNLKSESRIDNLSEVKKFYTKFLDLVNDYELNNGKSSEDSNSRDNKIKQFREDKILNEKLNYLEKHIDDENVDEEIKREYYLVLLKHWISKIEGDLKMLEHEIFILENKKDVTVPKVDSSNLKTFVITKDMVKNSVFGMGYKNLPTYSIEDFYCMQVEQGQVPYPEEKQPKPPSGPRRIGPNENKEDELLAINNDKLEDSHDEESRNKAIYMDNFKDENRRGCGNTTNRG